jgi:tetratricopeptide (TPR) repeat protein
MPEPAVELEQRAERAVRRGELLTALELFEELLAMQPDDHRLQMRIDSVRALLQPTETDDRGRPESDETEATEEPASLTDAEQGELHASAGRFAQAVSCYERAAAASPENELFRERLEELRALIAPGDPADLADAEPIPAPAPRPVARAESRSHKLAHANFAPIEDRPVARLPKDPVKLLETLLDRVRAGRR